jgi:outer membrane protein OmpA-like peptidoglycan-associated protein
MKMSLQRAILLVMCLGSGATPALAADGTLVLVMGGEAYDGPPKFAVDFDGTPLGEGTVAAAIDTATGRFADAEDKTPYVQTFTFAVPDDAFAADGTVSIRFLNEAYGGDGSNRDRNLYLASVTLNGRAITASGLISEAKGGTIDNRMLGEFLVLSDGNVTAIAPAPSGGWPVAAASPAIDPVNTGATTVPAVAVEQAAAPQPIDRAMLGTEATGCDLDETYNVIGFNENSNALTVRLTARLDQVIADIGDRRCHVAVTGYSSHDGPIASNALFSLERAQNALDYLEQQGVDFLSATATGAGATEQFGAPPDNRRVVISVTP